MIIGILASIALPKLAASREDAQVVVSFKKVKDMMDEIAAAMATRTADKYGLHNASFLNTYNIISDGTSFDLSRYNMHLPIDKGVSTPCVFLPLTDGGRTFAFSDYFLLNYGANDSSACKKLTKLLEKAYPNNFNGMFAGLHQHVLYPPDH